MNLRKIDALVAEHVMGHAYDALEPKHCYATQISAAWQVVEKLQNSTEAPPFRLTQLYDGIWHCHFDGKGTEVYGGQGYAATAPLAICLAALEARGIEVPE